MHGQKNVNLPNYDLRLFQCVGLYLFMCSLLTLSVSQQISRKRVTVMVLNGGNTGKWKARRDLEGRSHCTIDVLFHHYT
jgi:hypothetical protein